MCLPWCKPNYAHQSTLKTLKWCVSQCVCVLSTSSCMPHSNSMVTQASMGKAISLPLIFRCSSRDLPNDGFSTHASAKQNSSLNHTYTHKHTYTPELHILDDFRLMYIRLETWFITFIWFIYHYNVCLSNLFGLALVKKSLLTYESG